jgi:hypothetical protein
MIRHVLSFVIVAVSRVTALDASSVTTSTTAAVDNTVVPNTTGVLVGHTTGSTTASLGASSSSGLDVYPTDQAAAEMHQSSDISTLASPVAESTWINPSKPTQSQSLVSSPATTPPPFHIKPLNHTSRCLGVTNANEQDQDIAVV